MNKNKIVLLLGFLFLFCFALLSKFEDRQIIRTIDFAATVKIQDKIDKSIHLRLATFVDSVLVGSSFFAEPLFTSLAVLVLTVIAFKRKKWRAFLIPAAFILILLVEVLGKSIVHHPSPPFGMIKHPTSIFPSNYINEQFSYPSGHTARAVFIAIIAWVILRKKKWIGTGLRIYVLLGAVSRIYLGHHWLSDVIGGALLGAGLSTIILAL